MRRRWSAVVPMRITRRSKSAQNRSARPARMIALASPSARESAVVRASSIATDSAFALPSSIVMIAVLFSS
jgi:hypothetical protein